MANRPSIKEILEAARRGGPAAPGAAPDVAPVESSAPEPPAAAAAPPPAAAAPSPAKLGRPLTLKEKLAAARAGGSTPPAAAVPKAAPPAVEAEAPAEAAAPAAAPPAAPLGRPMTLAEKLAAARGGAKPAAAPAAGAKPAAAKAAAPDAKAAARTLPPLGEITDPRDLAEALRQTGASKTKEVADKIAAAKPAPKPAAPKPTSVMPKPDRTTAVGSAARGSRLQIDRRGILLFLSTPLVIAWTAFTAGTAAFTVMMGRFMFPNVLAEPPSTVKVGLPSNFDAEDVNERFKTEWGFWIVRTTKYSGQDVICAIQTVCTHLGCPPNWLAGEQKFKCPCHGSGYYITGVNFEGPAPRPLERFKVTLADDGQIMVDKSQHFQEELGQWSDPDSFIPV